MISKNIAAFCLSFNYCFFFSQDKFTLSGIITDGKTTKPHGVNVYIPENRLPAPMSMVLFHYAS
jgi:hypothetical protein